MCDYQASRCIDVWLRYALLATIHRHLQQVPQGMLKDLSCVTRDSVSEPSTYLTGYAEQSGSFMF